MARRGPGTDNLLEILLKHGSEYISGEAVAAAMGITRSALWKKVNALRAKGFHIQAEKGKGYRLLGAPDLSAELLKATVRGALGREVIFRERVGSTNDIAMESASRGAAHGTVVVADSQEKGRGRLGRRWVSPPGTNIYMSVILRPDMPPRDAGLITLMSAVACASALREQTGLDIRIKWPNDIEVSGKKLGGILAEMRSEPDRILYAVVGMGINVNMPHDIASPDMGSVATSVLQETGMRHGRIGIAAAVLDALSGEIESFMQRGKAPLLDAWRKLSSTLGSRVKVAVGRENLTGIALDIDDEGCLLLETPTGEIRKIGSGDVTMLRKR